MREKILIIFGAGASYDSVRLDVFDDWTLRPPLATELFAANRPLFTQYIDRFPAIRSIIGELRLVSEDGKLLERELERFQLEAEKDERRHRQLMAVRFYLQFALNDCSQQWFYQSHGDTNYTLLLDRIEHWRRAEPDRTVTYATFNHERLLERSAEAPLETQYDTLDSYISAEAATIIKPHGSVDWGVIALNRGTEHLEERHLIERAAQLRFSQDYVRISPGQTSLGDRGPIAPAIAIPFQTLKSFACPDSHLVKLTMDISAATRILVIGWRGAESHFLE